MARRSKDVQFTALMHHINVDLLRQSYYALKRNSAPGIDGMTWKKYGEAIEESLQSLNNKIHRGTYRPRPAKRTMIPKADGTQRPLSIIILYSIV
jgi:retron-type reverse transcriptase